MTPAEAIAPLPALRGLAVWLVGAIDADDLLQDVAEEAIRACGTIDVANPRGFLANTLFWRAKTLRQSRKVTVEITETAAPDDPYWHIRLREVDAFLGRMAEQDRQAIIGVVEGVTIKDPRSAAAQRIARARRQLVAALGEGA